MSFCWRFLYIFVLFLLFPFVGLSQEVGLVPEGSDFRFSLPLDCGEADGCRIVQFVDMKGGEGGGDFACSTRSEDGHRGTDYGLRDVSRVWKDSVKVMSSADGVVVLRRDGYIDMPASFLGLEQEEGVEWGNYVVVNHGGGWQTVYAHLKKGSLRVSPGQFVRRGEELGRLGFSGLTGYPHLHFEVLKDSRPYDPYSGRFMEEGCEDEVTSMHGRFDKEALDRFLYRRTELFELGFSDTENVSVWSALNGFLRRESIDFGGSHLGFFALVAGTVRGDMWQVEIVSPKGDVLVDRRGEVKNDSAMEVLGVGLSYSGKDRPHLGRYRGRFTLFRREGGSGSRWEELFSRVEEVLVRR
jgi:hypothetical protein